jgi:glycerol-3-phosphate dehydrogenase
MVGTTDDKCEITHTVNPAPDDISFIIKELKAIFGEDFDYEKNLLSAWSGIRPLVVETDEDVQKQLEKDKI